MSTPLNMTSDLCNSLPDTLTSDLCKSLPDILADTSSAVSMLNYFIQFMESEEAIHIIEFWLAVEAFKSAKSSSTAASSLCGGVSSPGSGVLAPGSGVLAPDGSVMDVPREGVSCSTEMHSHSLNGVCREQNQLKCDHLASSQELHSDVQVRNEDLQRSYDISHDLSNKFHNVPGGKGSKVKPGADVKSKFMLVAEKSNVTMAANVESECISNSHEDSAICCYSSEKNAVAGWKTNHLLTPSHLSNNMPVISVTTQGGNTDAMDIYTKYVALNATDPVAVSTDIRQRIEVNICPEDGQISKHCFDESQKHVYIVMETKFYDKFLRSSYLCKYQLEYISTGLLNLLDLLLTDNALFYFIEYMEQEGRQSLIDFWLMAENFRNHLASQSHVPDIVMDTKDAIVIYDRFFSLQAYTPIDIPDRDTVRMDVENKICDLHGPKATSFATAQEIVYRAMNEVHFPNFLKSSVYLRFLNELVHMINCNDSPAVQSTHLATCITTRRNYSEGMGSAEVRLEDLEDPDALWRRPSLRMRLGYVDEYGQYVSEVEGQDTVVIKSRFSWIINKRRQEEELTMRIAKNIVTEVLESCRRGIS